MSRSPDVAARPGEPIRLIRPVVVPAQFFIFGPLLAGFLATFPGFFTFVISNMIAGPSFEPIVAPGLLVYGLSFAAILGIFALKVFYEPTWTTYAIYPERIEFEDGLFNRQRRTVLLDRIIDVRLTEGVLQRTVGAGSIALTTQQLVTQAQGRLANQTFQLSNVPDPAGVYELIRSLATGEPGSKPAGLPE